MHIQSDTGTNHTKDAFSWEKKLQLPLVMNTLKDVQ